MKKLSTRLRSKWGKYVTRLPKGTPPDAVAFRDFIWGVYEQETAGQLVTELTNKTDPPTEPKPAAKTAAEPTTKRSEGGGVHAVADHVSAPPKPLLAIESAAAEVPFVRPPKCPCLACGGSHLSRDCLQFKQLEPAQRQMLVLRKGYCYACLHNHKVRACTWSQTCLVPECRKRHHPLLHGVVFDAVFQEFIRDKPART